MTAPSTITDNLVGYWDLNASSNPFDDLHNSNDGTNSGSDDVATGQDFVSSNSDYATFPMTSITIGDALSFLIRVNIDTGQSYGRVLHLEIDNMGFMLVVNGTMLALVPSDATGSTWGATSNSIVYDASASIGSMINIWGVISTGTSSKSVVRFYVEGSAITATTSASLGNGSSVTSLVAMTRNTGADYADGIIARLAFWDRELTAAEIEGTDDDYEYADWGDSSTSMLPNKWTAGCFKGCFNGCF